MTDDVESRRRRAAFRAGHRGTKEMDWLVGRFAQAHLARMTAEQLTLFERALAIPDPVLHDMILYPDLVPAGEFSDLIAQIRRFHRLQ